jgi:hypothetical protein
MVCEGLFQKPITKRVGGVAQSVGSEFNPQYHKKKKKIAHKMYVKNIYIL